MTGAFVVFKTHASASVGLGHLHRCFALGSALAAAGAGVELWVESGVAAARARRAGFAAREAEPGELPAGGRADVIVLDGYHYDAALVMEARRRGRIVVAMEDWPPRRLPAHVVLNSGAAPGDAFERGAPDTEHLLGPQYALLAAELATAPARAWTPAITNVLVTLGAAANGRSLADLVRAVRTEAAQAAVDVVLGPFAVPDMRALRDFADLRIHRDPADLFRLMRAADLAVTAAGQTMLQLAACATPTLAVEVHANQTRQLATMAGLGAVIDAGPWEGAVGRTLSAAVRTLRDAEARMRLGTAARQAVDGRGAERVVATLSRRLQGTLAIA